MEDAAAAFDWSYFTGAKQEIHSVSCAENWLTMITFLTDVKKQVQLMSLLLNSQTLHHSNDEKVSGIFCS